MSWSQSVYSSMVSEIGYDTDNQELLVTWAKSGKVSAYKGVPEEKALEIANSASVGRAVNEIKDQYSHRYA
jgi:hypothetical protein